MIGLEKEGLLNLLNILIIVVGIGIAIYLLFDVFRVKQGFENYRKAEIIISNQKNSIIMEAYVAETPLQRALGFMFKKEQPKKGMLFWINGTTAFWMKNVNFVIYGVVVEEGKIKEIIRMEPCKENCKNYVVNGEAFIEIPEEYFKELNKKLRLEKGNRVEIKVIGK